MGTFRGPLNPTPAAVIDCSIRSSDYRLSTPEESNTGGDYRLPP